MSSSADGIVDVNSSEKDVRGLDAETVGRGGPALFVVLFGTAAVICIINDLNFLPIKTVQDERTTKMDRPFDDSDRDRPVLPGQRRNVDYVGGIDEDRSSVAGDDESTQSRPRR